MKLDCAWITEDPDYIRYHDQNWGRPEYREQALFAMLCLEGQQAGLSWITILRRIPAYERCFAGFDPEILSGWGEDEVESLMHESAIIRNRLKIWSVIHNARAFLQIRKNEGSFSEWIWTFVGGAPIVHHYDDRQQVPVTIPEAEQMSKALKKNGFKFVGPTICYAYMQAVGMVNDHLQRCVCHADCQRAE